MAHSIAKPLIQTRLPRNPVASLIDALFRLDAAHKQKADLTQQPDHRLQDMGISRRDAAKAWSAPPMFLR